MSPDFLTVREAAESLGVIPARVYALVAEKRLRTVPGRVGQSDRRVKLILRADLESYRVWRDRLLALRRPPLPGSPGANPSPADPSPGETTLARPGGS